MVVGRGRLCQRTADGNGHHKRRIGCEALDHRSVFSPFITGSDVTPGPGATRFDAILSAGSWANSAALLFGALKFIECVHTPQRLPNRSRPEKERKLPWAGVGERRVAMHNSHARQAHAHSMPDDPGE